MRGIGVACKHALSPRSRPAGPTGPGRGWLARCRTGWSKALLAAAALSFAPLTGAGEHRLIATVTPVDPAALLQRARDASERRSFSGIFVVNAGGTMHSLRITHASDGQNQIDRIEPLDGVTRRIYRYNDRVHVLWPRALAASVEQRDLALGYPGAMQANRSARLEQYELHSAGSGRVAGMEAEVLHLKPRDDLRFAQRLWLERQSGLLLRTDIIGPHGEVIEQAGFSEIHWDPKAQITPLLAEIRQIKGHPVARTAPTPTTLDREGWALATPVPGFREIGTYRHVAEPHPSRPGAGEPGHVAATPSVSTPRPLDALNMVQSVYGDGVATVSLFLEPYDPARHLQETPIADLGATHMLSRRRGDWWITVVGDVPRGALEAFARALERRRP